MANERTFLAWFRTGLTLLALGLAAAQFLGTNAADPRLVQGLAVISILTGGFIVGVGGNRYWTGRERIDAETFRPARLSIAVTTFGAIAMTVLAIGFVLLLGRG